MDRRINMGQLSRKLRLNRETIRQWIVAKKIPAGTLAVMAISKVACGLQKKSRSSCDLQMNTRIVAEALANRLA